ncbi:Bacterial leucyl aminopeptidase precursor [Bacteroidales bacterium Barb4]|nr:Bacterial leucyl aminopeptidase precursor [Bacteroidales bacterium Barb4]
MKKLILCAALAGIIPALRAQVGDQLVGTTAAVENQPAADEALFRTHIKALSADAFGGRKPLSVHEEPVINYIAGTFKDLGLEPANGSSYFQEVPLLSVRTRFKNNEIVVNGSHGTVKLHNMEDAVVWSLRGEKSIKLANTSFVFAGFGINAPEYGWNDYDGIDVKGKIVIVLVNDPGYYDDALFRGKNMTYYGRWTYKFEEAGRQGAAGVLIIHDAGPASYDWSVVQNGRANDNLSLYSATGNKELVPIQGWVTGKAAETLFAAAGQSSETAIAAARQKGFKSFALSLKTTLEVLNSAKVANSHNVAAILPGTDLKDEYIIYSAHWDHLGIGTPIDGDSIYNGADDNASGVSALFLLANRFKKLAERPRRSILFLSVTAEESGLLGSEYYSLHPIVPLQKTVVNLNMDGYGNKGRTTSVTLGGAGDAETDRYVIEAAAAQGRIVMPAANQTSGGYFRSDHFNFAKVGVPVILAKGGRDYLDPAAEEAKRIAHPPVYSYHQPNDEYHDWWDLSGSLQDIYLFYGIGLRLSNDSSFPRWNEGIPYKAIREGK